MTRVLLFLVTGALLTGIVVMRGNTILSWFSVPVAQAQFRDFPSHPMFPELEYVGFRLDALPNTSRLIHTVNLPDCTQDQHSAYRDAAKPGPLTSLQDLVRDEWRRYGRERLGDLPYDGHLFTIVGDEGDAMLGIGFRDGDLVVTAIDLGVRGETAASGIDIHPDGAAVEKAICVVNFAQLPE